MANTTSPLISMFVGDPPLEVHVSCTKTDPLGGPDIVDSAAVLSVPNGAGLPSIATVTLDPAKPRSVIITPAASGNGGGPSLIFVGETGSGTIEGVQLNVQTTPRPIIKKVTFVDVGPVQ